MTNPVRTSVSFEVHPFPVPESVYVVSPPVKRQDGFNPVPAMKLSQLSEEHLHILCENFRASVFEKAGKTDPRK